MISARLRQSTITLYTYTGVDGNKKPVYSRQVIVGVFLDKDYQTALERRGIATKDTAQVIIDLAATPLSSYTFPVNSFFVEGNCTDTLPAKSKQEIAAERVVYNINRASLPPNGREFPSILEIYAR